jgi:hypothetical protein
MQKYMIYDKEVYIARMIWSFDGGDYEKCRLLGYKIPVPTSQGTYYFSATESSQLILCKISGFHGRWLWKISASGI